MTALKRLKSLTGPSCTAEQWSEIRPAVALENRRCILVVTAAFGAMMAIMLLASCFIIRMRAATLLYVVMIFIALAIYAATAHVDPEDEHKIGILVYLTICTILVYSTVLGTVFSRDQAATAYPAFVLAAPLLFTDRAKRIAACIVANTLLFMLMALAFDEPAFVANDIVNSCLFAGVSIGINSYTLNVKIQQEYIEIRLSELSSKDLLTRVWNRNSYEQVLAELPRRCRKSLCCIFADLNGLHELNEVAGHAAGDAMLKCVSAELKSTFGEDSVFRIGGDEFIVFICDESSEQKVAAQVEAAYGRLESRSCHVSFGVARQKAPILDMAGLIKQAERQMYASKRHYYEQAGIDRRGRRG